ncbi:MAG: type II toxin-antitoxin system HicA family toxin, partial [Dehalococcoidales bacterium]|nr:type II toxin-antitoxin system HicA family toxin [Dehalococcoidales bacterium]
LNFRGALDYLRGFDQVDNQMGWVYHRFQGQKCSRSAHLELIWEIPVPRHDELDAGTLRAIIRQATRYIPESELRQHFYSE